MNEGQQSEMIAGSQAGELLGHPAFLAAKAQILGGIAAKRLAVPIADTGMHTRLILLEQCWSAIERYLEQARDTGAMTRFQVEEEEKRGVFDFARRALRA